MAIESQKTKLYMSSSTAVSTSASALIGGITDFSGPGGEAAEIDITSFDSTAKEYIVGLKDEGSFSFNLIASTVSNDGQANLQTARNTRSKRKFTLDFSTISVVASSTIARKTFDGYVKGYSFTGAADDVIKAAVNIRITGDVLSTKQTT